MARNVGNHTLPIVTHGVGGQGTSATSSWLPMGSPLNNNLWLAELIGNEDQAFLSDGIQNDFQLAPAHCIFVPAQQSNYKSATSADKKLAVEQTILSEIAEIA